MLTELMRRLELIKTTINEKPNTTRSTLINRDKKIYELMQKHLATRAYITLLTNYKQDLETQYKQEKEIIKNNKVRTQEELAATKNTLIIDSNLRIITEELENCQKDIELSKEIILKALKLQETK